MATDEANGSDERSDEKDSVPPLEHRAYFDIDVVEGYVDIAQSWGDRTLYTPAEAREIAAEIERAADRAESGDREES